MVTLLLLQILPGDTSAQKLGPDQIASLGLFPREGTACLASRQFGGVLERHTQTTGANKGVDGQTSQFRWPPGLPGRVSLPRGSGGSWAWGPCRRCWPWLRRCRSRRSRSRPKRVCQRRVSREWARHARILGGCNLEF